MIQPSDQPFEDRRSANEEDRSLAELRQAVAQFVAARNWERFHAPKNLAVSILIEAAELLEHYQWVTAEQSGKTDLDQETMAALADELADVLIYCLAFANRMGIEPGKAVLEKLARNESRFPHDHDPLAGRSGQ